MLPEFRTEILYTMTKKTNGFLSIYSGRGHSLGGGMLVEKKAFIKVVPNTNITKKIATVLKREITKRAKAINDSTAQT